MPSTTRRRLVLTAGGLFALSGCSAERHASTARTTGESQSGESEWVAVEVENNDTVSRTVTVVVELDGVRQFERTLTLEPQSEPEFESALSVRGPEPKRLVVEADVADGGSTRYSSDLSPDDGRPVYVTVGESGVVVGRYEPAEPDSTTEGD